MAAEEMKSCVCMTRFYCLLLTVSIQNFKFIANQFHPVTITFGAWPRAKKKNQRRRQVCQSKNLQKKYVSLLGGSRNFRRCNKWYVWREFDEHVK